MIDKHPKACETAKLAGEPKGDNNNSKGLRRSFFANIFNSATRRQPNLEKQTKLKQMDANSCPATPDSQSGGEEKETATATSTVGAKEDREGAKEIKGEEEVVGVAESVEEEDDSYQHDLDDRLAREKSKRWRRLATSRSGDSPVASLVSPPPPRNSSLWLTNDHYIPVAARSTKSRSPLLRQFLESHQIQLESSDFSSSDEFGGNSDDDSEAPVKLEAKLEQQVGLTNSVASERDLRLVHWRLLAAKSTSTSSLPSSDSELDLLDHQTPALAFNCSDDTSCSSLELVWSRSTVSNGQQQQANNTARPLVQPQASSVQSKISDSGHQQTLVAAGESVERSAPRLANLGHQRVLQRLSIFELAKPAKAKARRDKRGETKQEVRNSPIGVVASPVQWVANPLFANDSDEEKSGANEEPKFKISSINQADKSKAPKRAASHDSLMAKTPLSSAPNRSGAIESWLVRYNELASKCEEDTDLDSVLDGSLQADNLDDSGTLDLDRFKRRRWSVRGKSPFSEKRDNNTYLTQIMNLDRRIKSNVSSIKSQLSLKLSDTSKRASILADQLITSIRDTTKEQFSSIAGASNKRDQDSQLESSFADSVGEPDLSTNKAKQFSLIFKHQQQANGQPAITRQPMPTGGLNRLTAVGTSNTQLVVGDSSQLESPNLINLSSEETANLAEKNSKSLVGSKSLEVQKPAPSGGSLEVVDESALSGSLAGEIKSSKTESKATETIVRRTQRQQANVAPPSDDDDDESNGEFYQQEYNKFSSLLGHSSAIRFSRAHPKFRSLNYWRRFRVRKLSSDWDSKKVERSLSSVL